MSATGVGGNAPGAKRGLSQPDPPLPSRSIVRLRPETWKRLASRRRPILDPDGVVMGVESFDRVVSRLLDERGPSSRRPPANEGTQWGDFRERRKA